MRNIKIRAIAFFLLIAMTLSCLPFTAGASDESHFREASQVQYMTADIFTGGSSGGWTTLSCGETFSVWSPDNVHVAVVDPYGNVILPASDHVSIKKISGWFFGAQRGSDNKYAMYMGAVRLTDYIYSSVEKDGVYARCEKVDGTLEYYYQDGNRVSMPRLPSGWSLVSLVGDEAVIVSAPNYNITIGGMPTVKYALSDWNGNIIRDSTSNYKLVKVNEHLLRTDRVGYPEYVDTKGNTILNHPIYGMIISSDEKIYMAYFDETEYYVMDENFEILWSFEAMNAEFLSSDKIIMTDIYGNCVVKSVYGRELLCTPCDDLQISTPVLTHSTQGNYHVGAPESLGFAVVKDNAATLYNVDAEPLCTVSDVSTVTVNDTYFVVYLQDRSKDFYSGTGEYLFTCAPDRWFLSASGVLIEKKDGKYAVCDQKGEPITGFIYDNYSETRAYGLLNMIRGENVDYYLVNAAGQELNEKPFKARIYFYNSMTDYRYNQKCGILRYIGPDDSSFLDVPENAWYLEAVEYCYANQLFSGTAVGRFEPESPMTRAMLVTVLWRLEGQPAAEKTAEFTDVKQGIWYSGAVAWAAENGIVNGVGNGKFDPDGNITREQMAAILYRYGQQKGYDMTGRVDISGFRDASQISGYAADALSWANAEGIIGGSEENGVLMLLPQGNATRAQVAAILMRFIENVME